MHALPRLRDPERGRLGSASIYSSGLAAPPQPSSENHDLSTLPSGIFWTTQRGFYVEHFTECTNAFGVFMAGIGPSYSSLIKRGGFDLSD